MRPGLASSSSSMFMQKTADNYDERTGGKMELQALKMHIMSRYGKYPCYPCLFSFNGGINAATGVERTDALFWEIQMIVLRSLLSVQPVCHQYGYTTSATGIATHFAYVQIMIHDKHCFELYGYDIIIDADLRPWLLEVNASPSLTANTNEDYAMKSEMLHGMLDIIDMDKVPPACRDDN